MSGKHVGDDGPGEPYLDGEFLESLFRVLTAAPSRSELAGGPAAMAAFRAVHEKRAAQAGQQSAQAGPVAGAPVAGGPVAGGPVAGGPVAGGPVADEPAGLRASDHRPPVPAGRPRAFRPGWRLRLGVAAAAALPFALLIGAAYAEALPAPVQRAAHQILGFAGVPSPGSRPAGPAGASAPPGSHASTSRSANPGPPSPSDGQSSPGRSGTPTPRSSTPPAITLAILLEHSQVGAYAPAVLSARVSSGGHVASGIQVSLEERPAGQAGWTTAASAVSSPGGVAIAHSGALTRTTQFRFTDEHGDFSATVTVVVVVPVTLTLSRTHGKNHFEASVRAPLASPEDRVIVQVMQGGAWQEVGASQVSQHGGPVAVRLSPRFAGAQVRALLPATTGHATSVSNLLTIPRD